MNRIISEVAVKPGAAEGNGRVWSSARGKNVFSIYAKGSRCQSRPASIGSVHSIYVKRRWSFVSVSEIRSDIHAQHAGLGLCRSVCC